jgi:hypothetical protein
MLRSLRCSRRARRASELQVLKARRPFGDQRSPKGRICPRVTAEACLGSLDASLLAAISPGSPWPQVRRERGKTLANASRDCQGESQQHPLESRRAARWEGLKAGKLKVFRGRIILRVRQRRQPGPRSAQRLSP